jgi:UDP:flavonoid glycosyltransferase YjiC (YdhE family)
VRVLFASHVWRPHYFLMVGLVWAFRAAGHEVRVAAQPALLPSVTESGAVGVAVGGGYDIIAGVAEALRTRNRLVGANPGEITPQARRELGELRMLPHVKYAADMAPDLVEFARWWQPDLVIGDPLVYAAPLAAHAAGAPLVRHLWGPDMGLHLGMPGSGLSAEQDRRAAWPPLLAGLYERYGVKPGPDVAAATLDVTPDSLQIPGVPNRIPVRYTCYNGPASLPDWLRRAPARPRVMVTWGSAAATLRGDQAYGVPQVLRALSGLDVEILIAMRKDDRARLGAVPDGVHVAEDLPLDLLLPGCQAIIHQSGGGTMFSAAYFGVPQVVLPQGIEHLFVAERLTGAGAGIALIDEDASVAGIVAATRTALSDPDYSRAACKLRAEMLAQPTPAEVVQTLVRFAGAEAARSDGPN